MDTLVIGNNALKEQRFRVLVRPVVEPKKKSFEDAVAECNGRSVSEFIEELRKRVKERYQNAKG